MGAMGSDTGGSIRGPAAWCGIAGHKPTYGLLSRRGILPLSFALDHAGPMCWTAEDCALMMQVLARHDPMDPASADVKIPDFLAGFGASLATTFIASIATGAFAAYHFNRLSFLGVIANLLGVPLTGFLIMPCGLVAMLLMPFGLERFPLVPMGWGIQGLDAIAAHVAAWPQAAMLVPSLPGASLWLLTLGGLWLCLWRRRWRLAGLPVAVAGLVLGPGPAPDLLMSEDGRVLGLRDQHGAVQVASARTDRFVTDAWARRGGQEGARKWEASAEEHALGLGCQSGLCRWRKGPWRVALVSDDARLAEACASADIVLSTVDAQGRCRGPRLVIDRRDAWREGAQALWLDEDGVRRETANGERGDRPWVPNSPSRRATPLRAPGA